MSIDKYGGKLYFSGNAFECNSIFSTCNGGVSFSPSRRMNDDINNAPQDKSRIVVDESGEIYGVWRDYGNIYNSPDIYFAHFSPCEDDFNGDGDVDGSDLAVFAADFGRADCP